MNSHQSDLDYLSGNSGDGHPITDPKAVFSDQEEISHDGSDYVLHRNGNASCDQAGKSDHRAEFTCEGKDDNDRDRDPDHDSPHQQKLVAAAAIMHVAKACATPDLPQYKDQNDHERENAKPEQQLPE